MGLMQRVALFAYIIDVTLLEILIAYKGVRMRMLLSAKCRMSVLLGTLREETVESIQDTLISATRTFRTLHRLIRILLEWLGSVL